MADNCSMACHGPDPMTRTGPVALDTYESVKMLGALVVNAVTTNVMPPWPADPNCRPLRDAPSITPAQRDLFKQWQAAGFPEGNPSDYVAPPPHLSDELGPPTRVITITTPHTPPPNTDEYTCGKGDYTFPKDTYVKAIEVMPDQKAEVHHVQIHVVTTAACTVGDNIYSWRPGGRRLVFSEGDAALIKAGSSFNFQMHYNTIGKTPTPDKTQVALWELPDGTKPKREVTRVGVYGLTPVLTPGAVQSVTATQPVGGAGVEIIGVSPHAHMIAKTMTANLMRAGKPECLTNIPDWKFEWQMDYLFKDPIPLMAGDTVQATCAYDNSPAHQPTVDGVKRAQPITVGPGEGTSDEMCLHYVWLRRAVP
jgi:Copper type II ascorbate-dependent monooxygenase, C-terminal domain